MAKQPIQTLLQLEFDQVNVSDDLLPDLLSFRYDDKETNEADEITIALKDPDGKWAGRWKPQGGESVQAWIIEGRTDGIGPEIYCGKFFVDSLSVSGSPRIMEIRAVSVPLNTPIRKKLKSRAWEKQTIRDIAKSIADENGVGMQFYVDDDITLDRQNQDRESDLKFLSRLCEDAGCALKVTDDALVIFDQLSYEKKEPVKTYILGKSPIMSWGFESQQSETYRSVTVSYRDPSKKKKGSAGGYALDEHGKLVSTGGKSNPAVMQYTFTDPDIGEDGQEYSLKKRAASISEAKRMAKAKLHELNRRSVTGSLSVVGDVGLVAGEVIAIEGFGSFDGNFIIETASHSVDAGGYTTSLSLRRVNSNY
jgi:phage protein D